jgi:hypothetical protein
MGSSFQRGVFVLPNCVQKVKNLISGKGAINFYKPRKLHRVSRFAENRKLFASIALQEVARERKIRY